MPSRRNRFYTENPYYTLFIRPTLSADGDDGPEDSEGSDDEGCYVDKNGQVVCSAKKSPPTPQPQPPWPDGEEDPDSGPFPNPVENPEDKVIQALANAVLGFFMPKPLQDYTPLQLPQRAPIQLPPVEPLPNRSIPTLPSDRVQQKAQETLEVIRKTYQDQLEQSLKRNQEAAKGRPDFVRDLADSSRQLQAILQAESRKHPLNTSPV